MIEFRTAEECFEQCSVKGQINHLEEIDIESVKALLDFAEGDVEAGNKIMNGLDDKSILWNNVYTSYYDALHKLVDALLRFDGISSLNHLCLFAYLCVNHSALDFNWNFFEKIRTKRNGIQYYGQKINKRDFKEIELQTKLYVRKLKDVIKEKLKE
ncbi:hypothetical protein HYV79_04525 [Candidatus Woesearchaeota archaeon]|nr:hypothetical protein [Candidatus Woesearchaeota archaeon]